MKTKRIIVTENMFLIKNLFYIQKVKENWFLIDSLGNNYEISGFTAESVEKEGYKQVPKRIYDKNQIIRFWNHCPKELPTDESYEQSIRFIIPDSEYESDKFYKRDEIDPNFAPDFQLTCYALNKLLKFIENRILFYTHIKE